MNVPGLSFGSHAVNLPIADKTAPPPRGLLEIPADELRAWLARRGEPALRAKQLRRWIVAAGVESFEQMSDLPKGLREELAQNFAPLQSRVARHQQADDGTHKLLLRLRDDRL